jgi:probable HAF family extracellular repeat protein
MLSRRSHARAFGFLISLALAVWMAGPALAQVFDVIELQGLGGSTTKAYAINSSGVIVGTSAAGGPVHAVRWTNLQIEDLGTLGGTLSAATALNASGVAVGYGSDVIGYSRSFLNAGAGMVDLGTLGGANSYAHGINNLGEVVGYSGLPGDAGPHAFLRRADGTMEDLGVLRGGNRSYAFAVTDGGWVAGNSHTGSGHVRAFLRMPLYGMLELVTLGGSNSSVYALREGERFVAAGSSQTVGNTAQMACVWDKLTNVRSLGTLGGNFGEGYAISAIQEVVGASTTGQGALHAFYWPGAGPLLDLNDLVSPDSGWVLVEARGIASGGRIVGWGYRGGQVRAFLLVPRNVGGVGAFRDGGVTFRGPSINPMSRKTHLEFDLAESGPARIELYDVQGRQLWAFEGTFAAGRSSVRWDGQDRTGQLVKSGFYWARLQAAGRVLTRAVTVIR